jgi:hypothetical protein
MKTTRKPPSTGLPTKRTKPRLLISRNKPSLAGDAQRRTLWALRALPVGESDMPG